MAGWMPVLGRAGYCAAKAALAQFFEVLREEVRESGIHILNVYPSFLNTPIETNALGGDGGPARHARSMVGAMGDAGQMARAILAALDDRRPLAVRRCPPHAWGSILWRLWPRLYLRIMRRKFAVELAAPS